MEEGVRVVRVVSFFLGLFRGVPDFEVFWSVLRARLVEVRPRCAAVVVLTSTSG